jgi:predicted phospho-2-dehydro-3-deoxyheptonate aldolase
LGGIMIGKQIRLERIVDRNTARTVIIPMDHGVTMGPIPGLTNMTETIDSISSGGANGIIIHKGLVRAGHRQSGQDIGLIVHLTGSTLLCPDPNAKVPVCTVFEAIKLGADAVSVHINLGADTEGEMLAHMGEVAEDCYEWGIPLVAMMYPRGEKIDNEYDVKYVKHAARVGAELGADIVKVNYTGSPETFREVVSGCPVPVVIAGGEKMDTDEDVLKMVKGALDAGAAGVSIGRNAFQHENPLKAVRALAMLVHENASIDDALKFLGE